MPATLALGAAVLALTVYAAYRRVDVRLVLVAAGLALGALAGQPQAVVRKFLVTLTAENFVVPICTAMGFAHLLRHTGCDRHLVQLLVRPLTRVRPLLVPGTVLVGFLVNVPVISQTSTAVAIGSVLVPLLLAAQVSPVTTGAALLLGASIGGELINPGAPEIGTISTFLHQDQRAVAARILPLDLVQLGVATAVFWAWSLRAEARYRREKVPLKGEAISDAAPAFRVNYLRALVPLVPLVLLMLVGPPFNVFSIPRAWLANVNNAEDVSHFSSRLVGAAMLVGVAVAVLTTPRAVGGAARAFFDGAGYAYTHIIALIVAAACFGEGIKLLGLAAYLKDVFVAAPHSLLPAAGGLSLAFACLSGSGMATTQALFEFFAKPAGDLGIPPDLVGAVVSLAAAAGRTTSPVAAVTLMCATLTDSDPLHLVRRVALPALLGVAVVVVTAALWAAGAAH
jgi:DcuC family C4-dicarboxylate transporter